MVRAIKWVVIVCFAYHLVTISILYFGGVNKEYFLFGSPAVWGAFALLGSYAKENRKRFSNMWRFYAIIIIIIALLRQFQDWGLINIGMRLRFTTVIILISSIVFPLGVILGKLSERKKYKERYEKKRLRNEKTRADNL